MATFPLRSLAVLTAMVAASACGVGSEPGASAPEPLTTDTKGKPVVYGTDNRKDVYAHESEALRARATQSTVALIAASDLDLRNPNNVRFCGPTLGSDKRLCSGERFTSDPTSAFCSGTLIDDDLVLTAGHCITNSSDCSSTRFVFKYYRTTATSLETVTTEDVFSCAQIVARDERVTADGSIDYAVIRLNRSAAPRFTPAPVRRSESALVTGQRVAVIGSGSGIPFKIDSGGAVREPGEGASFLATTDTFGGNSGSGVYDVANHAVVGILVEGDTDYVARGSCQVVNVCRESGCDGETVTYVHHAVRALCRRLPGSALCRPATSTGEPTTPAAPLPPSLAYTASATDSAKVNTADVRVTLRAGQTLSAGTCTVAGSVGTGDTFVRLLGADGETVSSNDDACGRLSYLQFVAPADGTYVLKAGCYGAERCGGTLSYTVE